MEFIALPFFLSYLLLSQVQSIDTAPEFDAPQEISLGEVREFDGVIEAYREIQLGAPVDGILETVNVERGDVVKKGQIIATLEANIERATLEIAAARTEMKGMLQKHKARLAFSTSKYAHDEKLHREGLLSVDSLDESRTEKLLAAAGYLEARENMALAKLERKRAEVAVEQRTIRSPIDAVVVERFLSPGEMVTRLNQSRIVAIAQVDSLRVEVILPADMFRKIAVGMKAVVMTDYFPGRRFHAKVKIVDRVIKAASSTFRVRLEIPNSDKTLPPGLRCRVHFSS